jgi:Bacterial Ig-like domain (group 3)/FG-GAP-like repeat
MKIPINMNPDLLRRGRFFRRHAQPARASASLASLALVTLCLAGSSSARQSLVYAQVSRPHTAVVKHRRPTPELTGSDGSQTGTASFQGNFTTIVAPSGQAIALYRMPDCSLTLATGSFNVGEGTVMETGDTPSYERVLHSEAGLTTTPDVFAAGCPTKPTGGTSSSPGAYVGTTTSGVYVFAAIAYGSMSNALYVLSGTTTFTIATYAYAAAGVLTAADLNGDGNGDLVVTNSSLTTNGSVSVLLGNPDGTFKTAVSYPTAGAGAIAAVIDDVNGDGKLDIVSVSDTQQISVLLGNGDGTFGAAQNFAAPTLPGQTSATATPIVNLITADLRHIGKKDIVCSNGAVLLGNGDGTFTAASAPAFPYVIATSGQGPNLASGDFNNDGKPDLVLNTGDNTLIYLGKGDGTFTAGNTYATINTVGFVTVNDLDGDGNADIYVGIGGGLAFTGGDGSDLNLSYALMGHGDGTFSGAPTIAGAYTGNNLGDVNGDGLPDLISDSSTSINTPGPTFTVQLGTAKGPFDPVSTITAPASFVLNGKTITGANTTGVSTFAVADINGDGKADLVFADNGLNGTTGAQTPAPVYFVALSNGDGTFATPVPYAFPQVAPAGDYDDALTLGNLQIASFTGSGHNDLVFTFFDEYGGKTGIIGFIGGFVVLPGNGDGTFKAPIVTTTSSSATAPSSPIQPQIVNTTDINGDGKADLFVINFTGVSGGNAGTELQLFLGNGDGTFKPPTTITTAANPDTNSYPRSPFVLADFNKDGKLDLACLGETTAAQAQLAISLGNGDGTFAAPTIFNLGGGDTIRDSGIAAADFDGDGNVDLALLDAEDISGIYYGKGDGTFTSVPANGNSYPKDLINLFAGGATIATDLNHDGKPDLLVNNTILLNIYGSAPITTPLASTTTALTSSAATSTAGGSVTFTATIAGPSGATVVPTGTVTFLDGTTTLGTGTLNGSGVGTYSTSALATGAHSITAQYGGDSNFAASTSAAVTVTVQAVPASFTVSASPTSLSITPGQTGTTTLSVTPAGGFAQAVSFACTGLPSEASCTFAPATVTPGASAVTTTLTITTAAPQASAERSRISALPGLLALGSLFLFAMPGTKRGAGWGRWFVLVIALGLSVGLSSCGGGGSGSGGSGGSGGTTTTNPGTPAGASTVTVTATSGSINQTATLQVTVP